MRKTDWLMFQQRLRQNCTSYNDAQKLRLSPHISRYFFLKRAFFLSVEATPFEFSLVWIKIGVWINSSGQGVDKLGRP